MATTWWSYLMAVLLLWGFQFSVKCQPPDKNGEKDIFGPEPIMSGKTGKIGRLGDWKQWTSANYNIYDQCFGNPDEDKYHVFGSFAMFFNWKQIGADKDQKELMRENSSLLVCYPSMADPKAVIPQAANENMEVAPLMTATFAQVSIDPNSTVSKECAKLKNDCKNDAKCSKEMQNKDEVWHGFIIKRKQGNFSIRLPFGGKNGKGIMRNITTPEDEQSFFLAFGTRLNFWEVFIVPGERFDATAISGFGDEKDMMTNFDKNRMNALVTDILPPDGDKIRLYTFARPNRIAKTVCKISKDDVAPKLTKMLKDEYIHATFLKPTTPKWQLLQMMRQRDVDVVGEPEEKKKNVIVKVNELAGKKKAIELDSYLPHSRFYFEGKLPQKGNFSIRIVQGMDEPTENLGEIILRINASFDWHLDLMECNLYFIDDTMKPCGSQFGDGFLSGQQFVLWMEFMNAAVNISTNCQEQAHIFNWKNFHYSPEAYVVFEGDIVLHSEGPLGDDGFHRELNENFTVGMPSLTMLPLASETGLDGVSKKAEFDKLDTVLFISAKFAVLDVKPIEISLVATTKDGRGCGKITASLFDLTKFLLLNVKAEVICASGKEYDDFSCDVSFSKIPLDKTQQINGDDQWKPVQLKYKTRNFNLIIQRNKVYKNFKYYSNGEFVFDSNFDDSFLLDILQPELVQVKGGISLPLDKIEQRTNFDNMLSGNYMKCGEYLIVYGFISYEVIIEEDEEDNNNVVEYLIKIRCSNCQNHGDENDVLAFKISLDMVSRTAKVTANSREVWKLSSKPITSGKTECEYDDFFSLIGQPFWVKIFVNINTKKYDFYINGHMLPLDVLYTEDASASINNANEILVDRDIVQLNNLVLMPYRDNNIKQKLKLNSKIVFYGKILEQASFVEMLLVDANNEKDVDRLVGMESGEITKDLVVYLHVRANKEQIAAGYVCYRAGALLADVECTGARNKKDFSFDKRSHKIELKILVKKIGVYVDDVHSFDVQVSGKIDPNFLLLNGDISLEYLPEIVKNA